jgi:hypothetical protein
LDELRILAMLLYCDSFRGRFHWAADLEAFALV